jgi:putative redox protein
MISVHASIGSAQFATSIRTENNVLVADEPVSSGGGGKGFGPLELLAASLASCTCITLRMYADRKKFVLNEIRVTVSFQTDTKQNITHFDRVLNLAGSLSTEQREQLLDIANHCPVHKILTNSINIQTVLI